jgi:hypothetical protein
LPYDDFSQISIFGAFGVNNPENVQLILQPIKTPLMTLTEENGWIVQASYVKGDQRTKEEATSFPLFRFL